MVAYLLLILIGLAQVTVGLILYLNSIVIEKRTHTEIHLTQIQDKDGRPLSSFKMNYPQDPKYKIVLKEVKK